MKSDERCATGAFDSSLTEFVMVVIFWTSRSVELCAHGDCRVDGATISPIGTHRSSAATNGIEDRAHKAHVLQSFLAGGDQRRPSAHDIGHPVHLPRELVDLCNVWLFCTSDGKPVSVIEAAWLGDHLAALSIDLPSHRASLVERGGAGRDRARGKAEFPGDEVLDRLKAWVAAVGLSMRADLNRLLAQKVSGPVDPVDAHVGERTTTRLLHVQPPRIRRIVEVG